MGEIISPSAFGDQRRVEMCMQEIQKVLEKWGCQVLPIIQFIGPQVANYGFTLVSVPKVPADLKSN